MMQSILALTLIAFAQAGEEEGTSHADRVAQDLAGLKEASQQRADQGMDAALFELCGKTLETIGESHFAPATVGAIKRKELEFCRDWNSPNEKRDGATPAKDMTNPAALPQLLREGQRALAELGVELLVVPIPLRLQVYPDQLPGVTLPEPFVGFSAGLDPTWTYLTKSGVEVLDLLPKFVAAREADSEKDDARLYLDYDLHWTPRGAALTADAIAERIQGSKGYTPGPLVAGEDFFVRKEAGMWTVGRNRRLDLEVAKEPVEVWYERVVKQRGAPAHVRDRFSEILVIGDSFTAVFMNESSDISSLLFARLGRRIDVISIPGGGKTLWQSLGRRGKAGMEGKKLVVWLVSSLDFLRDYEAVPLFGE